MEYEVSFDHIFISSGHAYYKSRSETPLDFPIDDLEEASVVAGAGIEGDRFFNYREGFKGQITFLSSEVIDGLCEIAGKELPASFFRRNIVTTGVALNKLIGQKFKIGDVVFEGSEECSPCKWMDYMLGEGAREFLKGRGGLRAKILTSGNIVKGPQLLTCEVSFATDEITEALA